MFGIILLLIFAGIVFWHYLQGLFSATLSAIFAVVAASLAVGYMEPLVNLFKPGKFADSANAMALAVLFVAIYLALRLIFDLLVPGNLRLQTNIDKIGGAVMGVIVALVTTGVIALVAQLLPLGADVGGYARYPLTAERDVAIRMPGGQGFDAAIYDELKTDGFADTNSSGDQSERAVGEARWGKPSGLWIPADDFLIGTVAFLSSGSLAADQQWSTVHPDYLQEIFGQRLGLVAGVARSAPNYPGETPRVTVTGVYSLDSIPVRDGLVAEVRQNQIPFPPAWKPNPGQILLVVRTAFSHDAADSDDIFRFAPANCRLLVRHGDGGSSEDYYPIGTLESARRLYVNRLDDPLFVDVKTVGKGADLVYLINHVEDVCVPAQVAANPPGAAPAMKLAPGLLLEVKRLGVVDLSKDDQGYDRMLGNPIEPTDNVAVMRQVLVQPLPLVATIDQGAVNQAPIRNLIMSRGNLLPVALGIGSAQPNGKVHNAAVDGDLEGGKFASLKITSKEPLTKLTDKPAVIELATRNGQEIVQFKGDVNDRMPWNWAMNLARFELLDDSGSVYHPAGAWCLLSDGGEQKMLGAYQATGTPSLPEIHVGAPTQAWIAFIVPAGREVVELRYEKKTIMDLRSK